MTGTTALALYSQDWLTDDAFMSGFVAHEELAAHLLDRLRRLGPKAMAQHQIIVGQRGMGKTSLLRRLAIGITSDPDLEGRYIPLRFREEQYNVLSAAVFWRNCGEALAEWADATGRADTADHLDAAMAGPDWQASKTVAEAFLAETRRLGRRPVLLVDNLDFVTDALAEHEQWAFRRVLQQAGGPVLFGAATRHLRQTAERAAPFYEIFFPHVLEPLSKDQTIAFMRGLSARRGAAGDPVRRVLAREPGRLRALHELTSGNLHVVVLIYRLLERAETENVFADLDSLLDQVTPYYKARIEEYETSLQRAVIDAIALRWDPATSRFVADTTGVEVTTISSQLTRLKRDGLIQEVPTSGARSGYQLGERFFNIWYLMRHGTRRTKQRIHWLAAFLAKFFAPDELHRIGAEVAAGDRRAKWHPLYVEAVSAALESGKKTNADRRWGVRAGVDAIAAPEETSVPTDPPSDDPEAVIATFDQIAARLGDSDEPEARIQVARALADKGAMLALLGRGAESIDVCDEVVASFGDAEAPTLSEEVARTLVNKGITLGQLGRGEEEIVVYDEVLTRFGDAEALALLEWVARALFNKGAALGDLGRGEEELAVYDQVDARFRDAGSPALSDEVARALVSKGVRLEQLGRGEEALKVYDQVAERFGDCEAPALLEWTANALVRKGNYLSDRKLDFEGAEAAYLKASRGSAENVVAKANLAWLYVAAARTEDAREQRAALGDLEPVGAALLDAGLALLNDNFGTASEHLAAALLGDLKTGDADFTDDLYRLLRIAEARGFGKNLIEWFKTSGHAERWAPVYAAFVAYVRGERYLNDVNPETRGAAKTIYEWLSAGRPEDPPAPPPKPSGRRRGRPPKRRS